MKFDELKNLDWQEKIISAVEKFKNVTFSTSFSAEDQLILDVIAKNKLPVEVFAIDTGRLPEQTYKLWQSNIEKYAVQIKAFYPDQEELADFVTKKGINAFYESVDLRKKCCEIRKVKPLRKALIGKDLWISGVRKDHSLTRSNKEFFEFDAELNITKFYPLLEISEEELWKIVKDNAVQVNDLYKEGYRSIGCAPCSRRVLEGEDSRAGRWWWEDSDKKECGLHR